MQNTYMEITYTFGQSGTGYMEIASGICGRITDMSGNTVTAYPVQYFVSDANPTPPSWGT